MRTRHLKNAQMCILSILYGDKRYILKWFCIIIFFFSSLFILIPSIYLLDKHHGSCINVCALVIGRQHMRLRTSNADGINEQ